jgi:membrane protein YdbS with pleckstrin-like domain
VSKLAKFLDAREEVVWSGKPEKSAFVIPVLGVVPFGLFFLTFISFFIWNFSAGAPDFFVFFALPLVVLGVAITVGPLAWQLLRYRNTEYVITNKRVITQTGAIGTDTRFVDFDKIQEVYVKIGVVDKLFGTGSLYAMTAGSAAFGSLNGPYGYGFGGTYGFQRPSLAALKEPYQVQKLLQGAVEKRKAAAKD